MTRSVDLNSDMGESFGPWKMGNDIELLDVVTSVNIACGMHAGDWDTMTATIRAAAERGVGIGAHPGFADLQGFGRRRIDMALSSVGNLVAYQVAAAQGLARARGATLRHLKLHGALANMAAADADLARACYEAALSVDPGIIVMVMAGSEQERIARDLGCRAATEVFADRAYEEDGALVDRRQPGAVIHDPEEAARRIMAMLEAGAIITKSGRELPCRIDTICVHGDTPEAIGMARILRARLEAASIEVKPFEGRKL